MAITIASAGVDFYAADVGADTVTIDGTYTPPASNLILVAVTSDSKSTDEGCTAVTHGDLTFSQIGSTYDDGTRIVSLWGAISDASPAQGSLVLDFDSRDQYYVFASVEEVSGADISGTVANAIVQSLGSASNPITLSAFASPDNAAYGQFFHVGTFAVADGFTQLCALIGNSSTRWYLTEWKLNDNTVEVSAHTYGMACEIKAASVAAITTLEIIADFV